MLTFGCENCGHLVFFHNSSCLTCGHKLAFNWEDRELHTYEPGSPELHRCENAEIAACNCSVESEGELCFACSLTRTRPNDDNESGLEAFREAEAAKRQLLFELGGLGLPAESFRDVTGGLAFDLLSSDDEPVTTGHAAGVITLDLAESDDVHRTRMQAQMDEPYRTLLGHFRHEVGHYYFPILTTDPEALAQARAMFGDEREDYGEALQRHYDNGPPEDWGNEYVSAYATMHPSEDWAETFAHFLHIRDTMQTAAAYRMRVEGPEDAETPAPPQSADPEDFETVIAEWLPLTYALNALNRSMGRDDLYPFILSPPAVEKLHLVAELARAARNDEPLG